MSGKLEQSRREAPRKSRLTLIQGDYLKMELVGNDFLHSPDAFLVDKGELLIPKKIPGSNTIFIRRPDLIDENIFDSTVSGNNCFIRRWRQVDNWKRIFRIIP